ncbi:hypothetical protein JGH11_19165 [Dysgonomonas sp. Marseille-P4677]|uniref:Spy/CpxP family protein refolding chaperone n=1 Tax=Dysgonomonas sp. Marseille-P4677 TaxID=2364790 RepID=UPI0019129937|nr:hypothetical protein [Dysgonomonas sp. Marseille-P4677]MBK5722993.1 hypothetical protein [Dysgonomonas sp. Marseille-P4677]
MKKIFLSLAIVASLSFASSGYAQENKKGNRGGFDFKKELNLSSGQEQKMETARSEYKAKADELKVKSDLSKEDKLAKGKELREQHMTTVKNILTPEQQAKMKELQSKRGDRPSKKIARNSERFGRNKTDGASALNRGVKDLNLTDDQKQKIKELNQDFRTKSRELAKAHREELNKVYTPEQQEKLKEFRKSLSQNNKFSHHNRRGMMPKLDEASKEKIKALKENFEKEKKAIELSRIAPDAQKQKIVDLRQNFRKERQQIIKDARKVEENKPV